VVDAIGSMLWRAGCSHGGKDACVLAIVGGGDAKPESRVSYSCQHSDVCEFPVSVVAEERVFGGWAATGLREPRCLGELSTINKIDIEVAVAVDVVYLYFMGSVCFGFYFGGGECWFCCASALPAPPRIARRSRQILHPHRKQRPRSARGP
jgi:hypothetical protein